ncbi:LPP20 family lipoprotein [Sulfurimonas sp.]|uniref:LPP20 family lipoprotein n=1 Tax=Sulfurimonas sp. TaxID=2022749 RepID=UPI0035627795
MKPFFVFLVLSINIFANPAWYHNVEKSKPQVYIGYGSGVDEVHAKQEAFNDIASQISVSVSTSLLQKQKLENGKFTNSEDFIASQDSKATLYDYELIKTEFYKGKYFVAIEYENIPSFDKFINKLKTIQLKHLITNEKQNSYLKHTSMAKKLKKTLKKDIDFELLRKDKKWYIKYKTTLQPLDKKDFTKFFNSVSNSKLMIETDKKGNILYDKEKFFFKVKSTQNGYISILSVYEDGTVSTLVKNIKVVKNKIQNIPDKDFESILQAGLMASGVETYDLYIAIYSPKKTRFESFAHADEELISEEKYKNFDELITFLESKIYTSLKVVTKPR